jgi:heat shock protein HslJ
MLKPLAATVLVFVAGGALLPARLMAAQATPNAPAALTPVVWQLTAIVSADGGSQAPDDPAHYRLQFLPGGDYYILADCNGGGGRYSQDGANLTLEAPFTTLMACPEGSLDQDYLQRLPQVTSFTYDDPDLLLTLSDGGALRFTPSLTGVVWTWRSFKGSDGSEVIPDDPARYTVTFGDDGAVTAQVDCNRGRGTYTAADGQIDISALATTRMACPEDSLGTEFARYLDEATGYLFRDGTLSLTLPADAGTAEFAAQPLEESQATPTAATPAT